MNIKTEGYSRKPFHVDAVQVTEENMEEVAAWCAGKIRTSKKTIRDDDNKIVERLEVQFIKVDVHRPLNERQTKGYVGDWVLLSEAGFKVYTERAFEKAFEKENAYTLADSEAQLNGSTVPEIKLTLEGATA
jgi:hypothetical protein